MRGLLVGLLALSAMGCDGIASILGPGDPSSPSTPFDPQAPVTTTNCDPAVVAAVAPAELRRLTAAQFQSSVRDVLADQTLTVALPVQSSQTLTELEADKHAAIAEQLVQRGKHLTYAPCNTAGAHDAACLRTFVDRFGAALFRRPLEAAESAVLVAKYDELRADPAITPALTFRESIDAVAQVMLQSPQLMYRDEVGVEDPALPAMVRRLTGYERATRLSYFLWDTTPDTALLAAAAAGTLDTAAGVREQAERLLLDPRARGAVRRFAAEWLELDGSVIHPSLESIAKDKTKFPTDTPALRAAMRTELEALFEDEFFKQGGSLRGVFTSPRSYLNASLAKHYGVTGGPTTDTEFRWMDLNSQQRAGALTRAGFLTVMANELNTSPIHRGVYLYRRALGRILGPPPPDVNNTPQTTTPENPSMRALVEARTSPAECTGCHAQVNPLGFALEQYDAIGRWQTVETGTKNGQPFSVPINSQVTLPTSSDLTGPVSGGVELSAKLGASKMAHQAMYDRWFLRAVRKAPNRASCAVVEQSAQFEQSGDLRELVLAILSSDAALSVQVTP